MVRDSLESKHSSTTSPRPELPIPEFTVAGIPGPQQYFTRVPEYPLSAQTLGLRTLGHRIYISREPGTLELRSSQCTSTLSVPHMAYQSAEEAGLVVACGTDFISLRSRHVMPSRIS